MRSPAPEFWDAVVVESFKHPFWAVVPLFWPCWSLFWIAIGIVRHRSFKNGIRIGYGVYFQTFFLSLIVIELMHINRLIGWFLIGTSDMEQIGKTYPWLLLSHWLITFVILSPVYLPIIITALIMLYKYKKRNELPKLPLLLWNAAIFALSSFIYGLISLAA